jgi:hypothetical protein
MQTLQANTTLTSVSVEDRKTNYRPSHIFVIQLLDGRYVIGQANNACKRIAAINSGLNPHIKKTLQVSRIIGIKPQDESRTFVGTVNHFINKYGTDNVLAV